MTGPRLIQSRTDATLMTLARTPSLTRGMDFYNCIFEIMLLCVLVNCHLLSNCFIYCFRVAITAVHSLAGPAHKPILLPTCKCDMFVWANKFDLIIPSPTVVAGGFTAEVSFFLSFFSFATGSPRWFYRQGTFLAQMVGYRCNFKNWVQNLGGDPH